VHNRRRQATASDRRERQSTEKKGGEGFDVLGQVQLNKPFRTIDSNRETRAE
jgi:hypothetical protein